MNAFLVSLLKFYYKLILFVLCMCVCLYKCIYYMCVGAQRPRERPSRSELQVVVIQCGCWEPNLGPRGEQQVLLAVELSHQPANEGILIT